MTAFLSHAAGRRPLSARMAAVLLAALAAIVLASAPAAARATPNARVGDSTRIDSRLLELTLRTPALAAQTKVRVLLPAGYARARRRRYPVLYLLHGAGGSYANWTQLGDAERITAGRPLIVVMPDAKTGWYTDWYNGGRGGRPEWETYHVDQLVPLIDRRYRTVATRRGRAIAGLSMGGFGAMSYAARHPDLFTYAASFSAGVNLENVLQGIHTGELVVNASAASDGAGPRSVFGDFETDNIRWRGHNPPDLAANLRGLELALYTGNGDPGGPFGGSTRDVIEWGAHAQSVDLHRRLARLHIPHLWDDYGPGSHTWPYWARDLRVALPSMMRRFAHPVAPPARVTYTSTESSYRVYGWRVSLRRPNVELTTLRNAGASGFALNGSGRATVTTPARYRPRASYRLRIAGARAGATRLVRADRAGRLRIALRLAPINRYDEGSPAARAHPPWQRATVRVRIARVRSGVRSLTG